MLTFFRRIRKGLLDMGAARKYLVYAAGEVLLVMVGILLALQVNNWNENVKDRKVEISILKELLADLNSDIISLNDDIKLNQRAISSNQIIAHTLENNLPYHDSLDIHFGNIQYNTLFTVNNGAYENLKSQGFDLLSNNDVRKAIIYLQDKIYDYLLNVGNKNNVINLEQFNPKYKTYFNDFDLDFESHMVSFTPSNYSVLQNNIEFLELINYQKFINKGTVQVLNWAVEDVNVLIKKIGDEIEKLESHR
jgi:hypothetical protein